MNTEIIEIATERGYYVVTAKFYGATNTKGARIRVDIRGTKYWYSFDYEANSVDLYLNPIKESLAKFCQHEVPDYLTWAHTDNGMIAITN